MIKCNGIKYAENNKELIESLFHKGGTLNKLPKSKKQIKKQGCKHA